MFNKISSILLVASLWAIGLVIMHATEQAAEGAKQARENAIATCMVTVILNNQFADLQTSGDLCKAAITHQSKKSKVEGN